MDNHEFEIRPFSPTDIGHIYENFGNLDVVGCEGQETMEKISTLGVTLMGVVKVWLKTK